MNMYTAKDLREEINWMSHKAVVDFLDSKGIKPVLSRKVSRNTYRLYDEAALIKCKELRVEREREQGLIKAPEPPATPNLYAASDLALDIAWIKAELKAIRKQADFLAKELSGQTGGFDDEVVGVAA